MTNYCVVNSFDLLSLKKFKKKIWRNPPPPKGFLKVGSLMTHISSRRFRGFFFFICNVAYRSLTWKEFIFIVGHDNSDYPSTVNSVELSVGFLRGLKVAPSPKQTKYMYYFVILLNRALCRPLEIPTSVELTSTLDSNPADNRDLSFVIQTMFTRKARGN